MNRARLAFCKGRLYRRVNASDEWLLVVADVGAVVAVVAATVTAGGGCLLGKCRECREVPTF